MSKIPFSFSEKSKLADATSIVFVKGTDASGTPVYAYCGISGVRVEDFFKAISSLENMPIDLASHCTVLLTAKGEINSENNMIFRDLVKGLYFFDEHKTNVLLFNE